jgi:hypothetical protein
MRSPLAVLCIIAHRLYVDHFALTPLHSCHTISLLPCAVRALIRYDTAPIANYDLSTLRVLGSVGEPINPEAWKWVSKQTAPMSDWVFAFVMPLSAVIRFILSCLNALTRFCCIIFSLNAVLHARGARPLQRGGHVLADRDRRPHRHQLPR